MNVSVVVSVKIVVAVACSDETYSTMVRGIYESSNQTARWSVLPTCAALDTFHEPFHYLLFLVPEFKITKFRDHLNGHNKHVVRLAEKELTTTSGKKYLLFALQLTGGGNFPSRHCHPEAAINAMWANTVPVLGMEVSVMVLFVFLTVWL